MKLGGPRTRQEHGVQPVFRDGVRNTMPPTQDLPLEVTYLASTDPVPTARILIGRVNPLKGCNTAKAAADPATVRWGTPPRDQITEMKTRRNENEYQIDHRSPLR
jgi:hypothetical protein